MHRFLAGICIVGTILGCGRAPQDPGTLNGMFAQIEGAVEDIHTNVFGGYYSGDLGDDQLGMAVAAFQKSVAGTALEADAAKLAQKVTEVSTLAGQRPPIAKLRAAVQELEQVVAEVKKKVQ